MLRFILQNSTTSNVDLSGHDAMRLQEILSELAKCKDDSQQRSWFLHEDEHIISGEGRRKYRKRYILEVIECHPHC